jgi:hypothetical protein
MWLQNIGCNIGLSCFFQFKTKYVLFDDCLEYQFVDVMENREERI